MKERGTCLEKCREQGNKYQIDWSLRNPSLWERDIAKLLFPRIYRLWRPFLSRHHSISERLPFCTDICSCGFSFYPLQLSYSSLFNSLLLFENVLRGGCHMIFLPAIWSLWHGDWLASLKADEEHSHIIPIALPYQPKPSAPALTLPSLVWNKDSIQA